MEAYEETATPVEEEKSEVPTTMLTFLGIGIDSSMLEMRLPAEKFAKLRESVTKWRGKKACKERDLLSLIGSLSHVCKIIKPGHSFLRRLIDLAKQVTDLNHFVRLNVEVRSDIEWWFPSAESWNGVSIIHQANY